MLYSRVGHDKCNIQRSNNGLVLETISLDYWILHCLDHINSFTTYFSHPTRPRFNIHTVLFNIDFSVILVYMLGKTASM